MKLISLFESPQFKPIALELQQVIIDMSDGHLDISLAPDARGIMVNVKNPKIGKHVTALVHDDGGTRISLNGNSWQVDEPNVIERVSKNVIMMALGWDLEHPFGKDAMKVLKGKEKALTVKGKWYFLGARVKREDLHAGGRYFVGFQNQVHLTYRFYPLTLVELAKKNEAGTRWVTGPKWVSLETDNAFKWNSNSSPVFFEMVDYG